MCFFTRRKIKKLTKKAKQFSQAREEGKAGEKALANEIKVYCKLAKLYDKKSRSKKLPRAKEMSMVCYRAAANLGDAQSQYELGMRFFDGGKFWHALHDGPFSTAAYEGYAEQAFKEAHAYMQLAEDQGHFLAKRELGLAYIHGWGVLVDQRKGFQKVVDSIEDEGAWDRATKIFEEIGLNKPEFFSTMMAMRKH